MMKALPSIVVFVLFLHRANFMGGLKLLRAQMLEKNQSAFELNGNSGFMIVAMVALFAVEIISGILFRAKQSDMRTKYYKILKFADIFLAYIAPYLLLMVLDVHQIHDWIRQLLILVVIAAGITYMTYDSESVNQSLFAVASTYMGLFLVPMALGLVLFLPKNLNWILYSVMYLYMGMEILNIIIAICNFIAEELEAIQQNKNTNDIQVIQHDKHKILP